MIEFLNEYIEAGNIEGIREIMEKENLVIIDGKLVPAKTELKRIKEQAGYWDQIQLIRKIGLNSVYGASIHPASEYFDQRMGQSCTLTARCTTRHMASHINEKITGKYELGDAIVYGDTDSCFFTIPDNNIIDKNKDTISKDDFLALSNELAASVNNSFSDFYVSTFNAPRARTKVIKCGREICATRVLFVTKKRYAAIYYVDDKNVRHDTGNSNGKLKIMGLDTQRADCPIWVQNKLQETLTMILDNGIEGDELAEFIRQWRKDFMEKEPWKMGTPKKVNKLTYYRTVYDQGRKGVTIPGHVRASIEWNNMLSINGDNNSMPIQDGQKVIVCKMKKNQLGIKSIAYPIDQTYLPDWFKELPFDTAEMTFANIDERVKNSFKVLNVDLEKTKQSDSFAADFEFE